MNQGNTCRDWYCCEELLGIATRDIPTESRCSATDLFSFLIAGTAGAVLNYLDGHPKGPPEFIIEVKKDLNNRHPTQHTSYFHFAKDASKPNGSQDSIWYQIKDVDWAAMKVNMEKFEICGHRCYKHDIEHGFAVWRWKLEETELGESLSRTGTRTSTLSRADIRSIRQVKRRESMVEIAASSETSQNFSTDGPEAQSRLRQHIRRLRVKVGKTLHPYSKKQEDN